MKILRYVINVALAVVLGDLLARAVAAVVYARPETVQSIQRFLVSLHLLKPDSQYDINGALLLVILVLSIAVVGLIVWALNVAVLYFRRAAHR